MSFRLGLSDFSLSLWDWIYEFWERGHNGDMPFSSHHITIHAINETSIDDANLDDMSEIVLLMFLQHLIRPFSVDTPLLTKQATKHSLQSRGRSYTSLLE